MDVSAFQTVFTSRTQSEADIIIGLLRSAGLHPLDLDTSPHFGFAGAEAGYRVEIPQTELDAARKVLSSENCGGDPGEPDTPAPMRVVKRVVGFPAGFSFRRRSPRAA
jgi:hypothetical protein